MTKTAAIAKIEATVAEVSLTIKGRTAEERALLAIYRKLPAAKQQEFVKKFAASEFARLQKKVA
jgi:hypothetical protein